jgi:hypothetical protein
MPTFLSSFWLLGCNIAFRQQTHTFLAAGGALTQEYLFVGRCMVVMQLDQVGEGGTGNEEKGQCIGPHPWCCDEFEPPADQRGATHQAEHQWPTEAMKVEGEPSPLFSARNSNASKKLQMRLDWVAPPCRHQSS